MRQCSATSVNEMKMVSSILKMILGDSYVVRNILLGIQQNIHLSTQQSNLLGTWQNILLRTFS